MTKEQWKEAENALKSLFNYVKLKIDGYEVSLHLERIDTYKNGITVYINGKFDGNWLFQECEERRRFCRKIEKSMVTSKQKAEFKKLPKKLQKEYQEFYNRKYEYYNFYWTSFNTLKRHLIKENENIELIEIVS